uniref:Ceramide synthase 5 n=2 Tax=Chrysemys picta bellii TaxID=8478 RepID=A0A8C3I2A3_CHRPI
MPSGCPRGGDRQKGAWFPVRRRRSSRFPGAWPRHEVSTLRAQAWEPVTVWWGGGGRGPASGRGPDPSAALARWLLPAEDGGGRGGAALGLVLERALLAAAQRDLGGLGGGAGPGGRQRHPVPPGRARPLRLPARAGHLRRQAAVRECPDGRRLEGLSKQLDWDIRKIQRWFRHRRNQDKPTILTKFCESMWRFTFYLSIFSYGLKFIWSSPWFWDTRQCWYNYPFQPLTSSLYYYYIMELAFYWSLMFSQFTDIKRKDFLIMFVHHLATIGLITFSYMNNMVRVGTLVLCLHDASDFLLEAAKLANYAKYQRLCDATFMLFGVVFIITRLGIYPFWILNTTLFESWELIGPYPSWWLFNGLLVTLQVLHIIWSCLIIRIAYKALMRGKVSKDDRSDVESSSEEDDMTSNSTKGIFSTSSNGANRINGHVASAQWAEEE